MSFDQLVVDPNYTAEEMLERIGELADTADNYRTTQRCRCVTLP